MRVKLNKAVKLFFGNSSLEMVYYEAIANSLDAGANKIDITISAKDFSQTETLIIEIEDNGLGFTDDRFIKFSNLFDVEESSHKGLGRLVYLCYFEDVTITSYFEKNKKREIKFDENFDGDSNVEVLDKKHNSGTRISMTGYIPTKLAQHTFIIPKFIKNQILIKFYSRLYKLKQENRHIEINIKSSVNKSVSEVSLLTSELPELKMIPIQNSLELFSSMELHYHIEKTPMEQSSVVTAISVDNRTYDIDIIAEENLPIGYKLVFLLYSDSFIGKVDASRQNLTLADHELQTVKKLFRDNVANVINTELPEIKNLNEERKSALVNKFPHLVGYIEAENIGYASQNDILKKAQEKFFRSQREILGASHLSDEQYIESLEMSARALTEYILFRQITINKLKAIDNKNVEADIHKLIVPMRQQFDGADLVDDLYRNNVWVLDDKFMTYDTLLSDEEMSKVVEVITDGEEIIDDDDRPDIAMVFSGNPNEGKKVDVVIIELKRKGLPVEINSIVEIQLEKRARKLLQYYNQNIQQIWFYGIVEFNEEFELHLQSDYHQLYSNGKVYYKSKEVVLQLNPRVSMPMGVFLMDFDAVVNDADARNTTFLSIIKSKFIKKD